MIVSNLAGLQNLIGYRFQNEELLKRALTHSSYSKDDNQRLEFLGDALLDFLVADMLFVAHPDWDEGRLTKTRAALVSREPLCALFDRWQLGNLLLSHNLSKQAMGNKLRSDIIEAILGAIYLDGGLEPTKVFVERFVMASAVVVDDFKSKLLEKAASIGRVVSFETVNVGDEHKQVFESVVYLDGAPIGKGKANSKKKAEQMAAGEGLQCIS